MSVSGVSSIAIVFGSAALAIDSESNPTRHPDWSTGIRIGNATEDKVTAFIPPHEPGDSYGAPMALAVKVWRWTLKAMSMLPRDRSPVRPPKVD
ncbi:MAG: hypothetical protein BMS9Abin37_1469 [Acidobacteriota bacterium]|nr:MAG: hypothetical protein BMS9Abin37_1469 [Acidobacteriota bacterium]